MPFAVLFKRDERQMSVTKDDLPVLENRAPCEGARIGMISLPLPEGWNQELAFEGLPCQTMDVGWRPPSRNGGTRGPRRRLVYTLSDGPLPATLRAGKPAPSAAPRAQVEVALRTVHKDYKYLLPSHVSELELQFGDTKVALRMGLRWKQELHWWQWVRLEKLSSGPLFSAWRVGGAAAVVPLKVEDVFPKERHVRKSHWLHRQNWLFTEVYLLCFANGVVQFHCRYINNHMFDEGQEQKDVTPLIAFSTPGAANVQESLTGAKTRFALGAATLDLRAASALVSPEHPGALTTEDGFVLYQPYEGVEIGGDAYKMVNDDTFFVHARDRVVPRGVARTVRFHMSLGAAAPVIDRYVAPEWWYALCGDTWPDAVLPVHDSWNAHIDRVYESTPPGPTGRFDDCFLALSREGETPFAGMLYYYRTGRAEHLDRALRDAYHIADLAFDHATETIRMHNYPFDGTISPALFRAVGMLFGYLETGDPYLRECAESTAVRYFWIDKHNWPRMSYGRDAASVRSLVFLADFLGEEHYRTMARDCIGRLIQCQDPDGSYADQGGAPGIHAVGQVCRKPWMANLANEPIFDYLTRWPDDPVLWDEAVRYGGYLMKAGVHPDGTVRWPYQTSYGEGNYDPWKKFYDPNTTMAELPDTYDFTLGYKARTLSVLTRHTGDPRYYDAWMKYFDRNWADKLPKKELWPVVKTLQTIPYAQAHTWNARWDNGTVRLQPIPTDYRRELSGTVLTPRGPVILKLRRTDAGRWEIAEQKTPPGVTVEL